MTIRLRSALLYFVALLFPFVFSACSDDKEEDKKPNTATVQVYVQPLAEGRPLQRDQTYRSPAGDTYSVQKFRFYISNVKLINENGRVVYVEPDSYHLITLDGKQSFTLKNVPPSACSRIEFSIGVNESRNHSIDQFGDLDPSNDMVWDWKTGYKFLLLEGLYTGDTKEGGLVFHIGEDKNYTVFGMDLAQPMDFTQESEGSIVLQAEINELFSNPHLIDFDELNTAMGGENASKIVENYRNGFIKIASGE